MAFAKKIGRDYFSAFFVVFLKILNKKFKKMIKYVFGEEPFTALNGTVMISPSNEDYYLEYSADGQNFARWEDKVPAGEPLMIIGNQINHAILRLAGNKSKLRIKL